MPVEFLFLYDNISTAYNVQKKLENLRTYFGKEYGKELESKPHSDSGAVKAFHSSWRYYKPLMLLKDQVWSDRPTVCNLTVGDDLDSACSPALDPETPKKPVKKTTKKLTTDYRKVPDQGSWADCGKNYTRSYNFTKKVKTEWWWTFWPNSCSTISTAGRGGGKRKLEATNVNSQFAVWNTPIPAVHAQKQYSISMLKIVQSWNI